MTLIEAQDRVRAARLLRLARSRVPVVRRDEVAGYTSLVTRLGLPRLATWLSLELLPARRAVIFATAADGSGTVGWRVGGRWVAGYTLDVAVGGLFRGVLLPLGADRTDARLAAKEQRRYWRDKDWEDSQWEDLR